MTWGEQHLPRSTLKAVLDQLGSRPVIIVARANDELDLIVGRQQVHVLVAIAMGFLGVGGLKIDYSADSRIDRRDIQGATGFQRDLVTGITQLLEQGDGIGLRQWLAARYTDVARPVTGNLLQDVIQGAYGAAAESIGAVTVLATQGAAGEPYEYGGQASSARFTLQRVRLR